MNNNKTISLFISIIVAFSLSLSSCQNTDNYQSIGTATSYKSIEPIEEASNTLEKTEALIQETLISTITSERDFIAKRIERYTNDYFRFTEEVVIESEEDNILISVKFVPETGSIIIKEELYENIASHAYQITRFFPEVNHFDYLVLCDDYSKEEALFLTIGEEAVINLESTYINQLINRNGGLETHFAEVFSEIVETEESMTWRVRVDPDSQLP